MCFPNPASNIFVLLSSDHHNLRVGRICLKYITSLTIYVGKLRAFQFARKKIGARHFGIALVTFPKGNVTVIFFLIFPLNTKNYMFSESGP